MKPTRTYVRLRYLEATCGFTYQPRTVLRVTARFQDHHGGWFVRLADEAGNVKLCAVAEGRVERF